jgi:hypothetical protein
MALRPSTLALLSLLMILGGCALSSEPAVEGASSGGKADGFLADDQPWVVGLYAGGIYCTGSLIGARTVLTAAHCVEGRVPEAVYFGHDRRDIDDASLIDVVDYRVHHGYRGEERYSPFDHTPIANDLAVLTLAEDATATPAALNEGALDGYVLGQILTTAGWTEADVEGRGDGRLTAVHNPLTVFGTRQIYSETSEVCPGDSGGPSFVMTEEGPVQLGITSWGGGGCSARNVSMRVDAYLHFITDVMADHDDAPRLFDVPAALRGDGPPAPWPVRAEPFDFEGGETHEATLEVDEEGEVGLAYVLVSVDHTVAPLVDLSIEHDGQSARVYDGGFADPFEGETSAFTGHARAGTWTLRVRISDFHGGGEIRAWGVGFVDPPE